MTLNATLTLNGIETQVLITYDTHIQSVQDGKEHVLHLLSPDQVKALETEIAWQHHKKRTREDAHISLQYGLRSGVTEGFAKMMEGK